MSQASSYCNSGRTKRMLERKCSWDPDLNRKRRRNLLLLLRRMCCDNVEDGSSTDSRRMDTSSTTVGNTTCKSISGIG